MSSDLQTKLYQFEASPPEQVWTQIVHALDAEENFPRRLYHYEEQPPLPSWQSIATTLDRETGPHKRLRSRKPARYAVLAGILAVILVSTSLLLRRTESGSIQARNETSYPAKGTPVTPISTAPAITENSAPSLAIASIPASQRKKSWGSYRKASNRTPAVSEQQHLLESVAVTGQFLPQFVTKEQLFDFSSIHNYMVYTDGEGNAIKLSKRLFNLVHCQDGDNSCKERIQQLRQKLSAQTLTNDFAGVMEILRQLQ